MPHQNSSFRVLHLLFSLKNTFVSVYYWCRKFWSEVKDHKLYSHTQRGISPYALQVMRNMNTFKDGVVFLFAVAYWFCPGDSDLAASRWGGRCWLTHFNQSTQTHTLEDADVINFTVIKHQQKQSMLINCTMKLPLRPSHRVQHRGLNKHQQTMQRKMLKKNRTTNWLKPNKPH